MNTVFELAMVDELRKAFRRAEEVVPPPYNTEDKVQYVAERINKFIANSKVRGCAEDLKEIWRLAYEKTGCPSKADEAVKGYNRFFHGGVLQDAPSDSSGFPEEWEVD